MPANVVKTKAEEKMWERAKKLTEEQYGPLTKDSDKWGVVMTIFKNIRDSKKKKKASLRARTIRLASTRPDLRPHLLPLLVKTAESYEDYCDFGSGAFNRIVETDPALDTDGFFEFAVANNKADRDAGELQDIAEQEVRRLADAYLSRVGGMSRRSLLKSVRRLEMWRPRTDKERYKDQEYQRFLFGAAIDLLGELDPRIWDSQEGERNQEKKYQKLIDPLQDTLIHGKFWRQMYDPDFHSRLSPRMKQAVHSAEGFLGYLIDYGHDLGLWYD